MISYRHDIDGLRCLAVLLVVLFHIQLWPVSGGFIGVDVFFVISGFLVTTLITRNLEQGTFRFSDFYARRIRRLFPAIYATVVLSLIAGWFLFPPDAFSDLAQSSIATVLSGSNIYFWVTSGYFEPAAHYKPLLHTWSLAIEEQFYLIWPVSIVLIAGTAVKRKRIAIALVCAVIISTFLAEWAIRANHVTASFFLLPFRINEFGIGALIAFVPVWKSRLGNNGLALAGLVGIVVPAILFTPDTVFPGINAMIPCLATAALIYAGRETIAAKILSNPIATYVGRMSYSFYLAHWPIIAFYLFWRGSAVGLEPTEQAFLFAASFVGGAALYHFVEAPFRITGGTAKIAPGLGNTGVGMWFSSSTIAVILASVFIWGYQGLPSRFDGNEEIPQLLASMDKLPRPEFKLLEDTQPGPTQILLIGDSHAGVSRTGFFKWAAENNAFVTTKTIGGCIPLLNVQTSGNHREACQQRNFEDLNGLDYTKFDAVVLLARWGLYTSIGTENGGRFGILGAPILLATDEGRHKDVELSRRRFYEALNATVQKIEAADAVAIFVGQVPHIGENPKPCLVRSRTAIEAQNNCNAATFESAQAETSWATARAKDIDFLTVYDPTPLFCPNNKCLIMRDGKMLYRDGNHLSPYGADVLLEGLSPVLKEAFE